MTEPGAPAPIVRWLAQPEGAELPSVWPAATRSESFQVFYGEVMRHARVDPRQALEAIRRISAAERRKLLEVERLRLVRLRAHVHLGSGDAKRAVPDYRRAWRGFEGLGATAELGATGIGWVAAYAELGELQKSMALAEQVHAALPATEKLARARLDVNLNHVLFQLGDYDQAIRRCRAARGVFRRAGAPTDAAFCDLNLGHNFLVAARAREAGEAFAAAEAHLSEQGLTGLALQCRAGLGFVKMLRGEMDEALPALESIKHELRELGDERYLALVSRRQAEYLLAYGALEQAQRLAGDARSGFVRLGLSGDVARTSFLQARTLLALGRPMDARVRAREALEIWERLGNRTDRLRVQLELAAVYLARGNATQALAQLEVAARPAQQLDAPGLGVRCRHLQARAHLATGEPRKALGLGEKAYRAAARMPTRLERPWIALTVAQAHAARSDAPAAIRWARRAVEGFERLYLALGSQAMRGQASLQLQQVTQQLTTMILGLPGEQPARIALDLSTRLRSPQLVEDLLGPVASPRAQLRHTIARFRDDALTLDREESEERRARVSRRLEELDAELDRTMSRRSSVATSALAEKKFDRWVRLLEGRPLVQYEERGNEWGAYVVRGRRDVRHVPLPDGRRALADGWVDLRMLLDRAAHLPRDRRERFLRATAQEAEDTLRGLRQAFWEPLALDRSDALFVPTGDLQSVPLECLPQVGEVGTPASRWPHPAVVRLRRRRSQRSAMLLDDRTPERREETRRIGRVLRGAGYEVRRSSRRDAFLTSGASGIVHFATHGCFHRPRWMLNGLKLADGWLGFEQLRSRFAAGGLAYFGSCESGLVTDLPGAELDGWLSAALGAGASEVVATLWKVDDETARTFAEAFYREWSAGESAAGAAATARRVVAELQPHPYAWAAFATVG